MRGVAYLLKSMKNKESECRIGLPGRRMSLRMRWSAITASAILMSCMYIFLDRHLVLVNTSASMPRGLWVATDGGGSLERGDVVAVRPPKLAREYGCVRPHQVLLKQVIALSDDRVCLRSDGVVEASELAPALTSPAPVPHALAWEGCRTLEGDELFVAGEHERSCDSRYFGVITTSDVVSTVRPVYTLEPTEGLSARIASKGGS